MLVSPAEPPSLRALGEVSSLPETMGSDFLLLTNKGIVGVQRKEVSDLVSSVHDGRFNKEMAQLCSSNLHQAILVVEGDWRFDQSGKSIAIRYTNWTRKSWHGIELSTQHLGIWIVRTDNMGDTAAWLTQAETWLNKSEHLSLATRPKVQAGVWDNPERHFWVQLLSTFPGISAKTAGAIYDKATADGVDLLHWGVDEAWLLTVPGVAKGRAKTLMSAFKQREEAA